MPASFHLVAQEPLRLGIGLVALAFYMWLIHSYKLPGGGDIAVAALIIGVFVRGGTLTVPAPLKFFLLFILWNALGLTVTADTVVTTDVVIGLAKLWIITFCLVNTVRTAAELRFLIIGWLAIYALYPVRGAFFNQYICQCTEFGRVGWNFVFENPNDLAALSLIPLGLAGGVATVERTKLFRWAGLAGVAVLSLLIMLTQSRGALIALAASGLLLFMTSRRKTRDFVILVALFSVAAVFAPKDVWSRLAGLTNASVQSGMAGVDKEGSAEARWTLWKIAAATARDNPFLGVGPGMMPKESRLATMRGNMIYTVRGERDTHSTYLRIAADNGFPGVALYLSIWVAVFWKVRAARRSLRATRHGDHQVLFFLELGMFAFMVAAIFGTFGTLSFTYLSMGVAWLAAEILQREPWYGSAPSAPPVQALAVRRSR
jgi:O-antigen ligase